MIPFHCGTLLPPDQRATSPKFKRVRRFRRYDLDLHTGAELIAFVRLVGFKTACLLFDWHDGMIGAYKAIEGHEPMARLADAYEQANAAALDGETGWYLLKTMIDAGFRRGSVPKIVADALRERRGYGMSAERLSRELGRKVSRHQIQTWITPKPPRRSAKAAAAAALAVG